MGTIKQWFKAFFSGLKIDIKLYSRRLFLAAVVLFCLSWTLISPVKGIEQIFLSHFCQNKSVIIEEAQDKPYSPETISPGTTLLAANTLASLTNQKDNSSTNLEETITIDNESDLVMLQTNALSNQNSPLTFISQEPRTGIITYTVQENDTPSSIAAFFGVSINTILWANNLKETSLIRPGDNLTVLPVSGVLHRVKNNETIDSIAKTYKAKTEEIIAFNNLPADGAIQIGEKIVIPEGQMPAPAQPKPSRISQKEYAGPGTGKSNSFPYGQCTWYVAQKRVVPWSGHAKSWLANSRAAGYQTGDAPQAGAIIVTKESWYGHVGYVETVNGSWVTFSEMNHLGWGLKDVRTLHVDDPKIRGYIY